MSHAPPNSQNEHFAFDSLQAIRNRLLDLTGRNRLLNFRHGRSGYIRLIDANPNQLAKQLLEGDTFSFRAIPEPSKDELITYGYIEVDEDGQERILKPAPTVKEWADIKGLNSEFDLAKHATKNSGTQPVLDHDKNIPSLLFANALEGQLRRIRAKANSAIEETGANILYIAFGFLQWFEQEANSKAKLAPLYLLPVKIEKASLNKTLGVYNYTIEYTGEDLIANLSLREKLKHDFNLPLPELEDDLLPQDYWQYIEEQLLPHKANWQLKGYCTLGMFDFSKLLMYLDLDPERWPQTQANILHHSIVQSFFGKQIDAPPMHGFASEHLLDDIDNIHQQYPLIYDADSSQHSALIDALQGKNLVIEGPPGTGKSQSITNLIAAAMARGKKVLFVAEKMAALQVVKKRLSKAGLGDFCLELHSHKTHKKQVYKNIAKRIQAQSRYQYPDHIDLNIQLYEKQKRQLNQYATLINQMWQNTEKTIGQILTTATRYRLQFSHFDVKNIKATNSPSFNITQTSIRQTADALDRFIDVQLQLTKQLGEQAQLNEHPWYGVTNSELQLADCERIHTLLTHWSRAINQLLITLKQFQQGLGYQNSSANSAIMSDKATSQLLADFDSLKLIKSTIGSDSNTNTKALANLTPTKAEVLQTHIEDFEHYQAEFNQLKQTFNINVLQNQSLRHELKQAVDTLSQYLQTSVKLPQCVMSINSLQQLPKLAEQVAKDISVLAQQEPALTHYKTQTLADLHPLNRYFDLISDLDNRLITRRHALFDNDQLDNDLPNLFDNFEKLNHLKQQLTNVFTLDDLPSTKELSRIESIISNANFFCWFSRKWRNARACILSLAKDDNRSFKELCSHLQSLLRYQSEVEAINEKERWSTLLQHEYQGLNTPINDIMTMRAWYKKVRLAFGIGFGRDIALAKSLFSLDSHILKGMKHVINTSTTALMTELFSTWQELEKYINTNKLNQIQEGLTHTDIITTANTLTEQLSTIRFACQADLAHSNLAKNSDSSANSADKLSLAKLHSLVQRLEHLHAQEQTLINQTIVGEIFADTVVLSPQQDCQTQLADISKTLKLYRHIMALHTLEVRDYVLQNISMKALEDLISNQQSISQAHQHHLEQQKLFSDAVKLNASFWLESDRDLTKLLKRNQRALAYSRWLGPWLDFLRLKGRLDELGLHNLLKAFEQGECELKDLTSLYKYSIYDSLAVEIMRNIPALAQFSGAEHNAIIKQFSDIDDQLKPLQQQKIAYQVAENGIRATQAGIASGKVGDYTEMGLINHEINKKTRHVPIRQLLKRASQSLLALKPCFMMGPHSVAKYLRPGDIEFDIIVMDEASQIKPEDALGTIARGKQLVVVGDPKQLPPTSFFDRAIDNDDDDLSAIELSESILDVSLPIFHARRLRWHYRSRHESLIAFSNQQFYDDNLVVFPSPASHSDEFGVKFTYIQNGRFIKQKNSEEAKVIAQAVRNHLLNHSDESLGVVAMSVKQQEQIENAVEALTKSDDDFAKAIAVNEQSDEPLFIKNLENVQGDERDVIYISFTYGPDKAGETTMAQRFGPINSSTGWRRLNVLFTRSKKRMHAFSSMTPNHIKIKDSSSHGVRALQQFLQFAQSGQLNKRPINTEADSNDFAFAVNKALNNAGFNTTTNVGVAGYFINIAVQATQSPGHFLMGIESDGKAYFDAKSARDRDRLLPAAPKRLGWHLMRIWSPDWYKNPEAQILPIIETLKKLDSEISAKLCKTVNKTNNNEKAQIEEVLQNEQQQMEVLKTISEASYSLHDKLVALEQYLIKTHPDNIAKANRLLRPAMIEALCEFTPNNESDYFERLPEYLRIATAPEHHKYLPLVFTLISETETEIETESKAENTSEK
ncbi:DUF4011 domain-containing anti-phage protein Hhe [Thalassotalea aquiviva]|uniref:DUF4011 domain-containing anti-phage protein Hhe n=1 Tax=Thalassotalea aquiviva TaxID=3242415 RepID=UPI00352A4337